MRPDAADAAKLRKLSERNRAAWGGRGRGNDTESDAIAKQARNDVTSRKAAVQKGHARYSLLVCHYRTRLADVTNPSIKAALDGIVDAGVLVDDSPKYLSEVQHRQIKVGNADEERTVFVFVRTERAGQ